MNSFLSELRRRNVYKVAVAYAVVGWLLVQIATQTFPFFEVPNWAVRLVILLVVIGFPVALIIAWAFELTPEGLKRTESDANAEVAPRKQAGGQAWLSVVIAGLALSAGLFFLGRYTAGRTADDKPPIVASSPDTVVPEKSVAVAGRIVIRVGSTTWGETAPLPHDTRPASATRASAKRARKAGRTKAVTITKLHDSWI